MSSIMGIDRFLQGYGPIGSRHCSPSTTASDFTGTWLSDNTWAVVEYGPAQAMVAIIPMDETDESSFVFGYVLTKGPIGQHTALYQKPVVVTTWAELGNRSGLPSAFVKGAEHIEEVRAWIMEHAFNGHATTKDRLFANGSAPRPTPPRSVGSVEATEVGK